MADLSEQREGGTAARRRRAPSDSSLGFLAVLVVASVAVGTVGYLAQGNGLTRAFYVTLGHFSLSFPILDGSAVLVHLSRGLAILALISTVLLLLGSRFMRSLRRWRFWLLASDHHIVVGSDAQAVYLAQYLRAQFTERSWAARRQRFTPRSRRSIGRDRKSGGDASAGGVDPRPVAVVVQDPQGPTLAALEDAGIPVFSHVDLEQALRRARAERATWLFIMHGTMPDSEPVIEAVRRILQRPRQRAIARRGRLSTPVGAVPLRVVVRIDRLTDALHHRLHFWTEDSPNDALIVDVTNVDENAAQVLASRLGVGDPRRAVIVVGDGDLAEALTLELTRDELSGNAVRVRRIATDARGQLLAAPTGLGVIWEAFDVDDWPYRITQVARQNDVVVLCHDDQETNLVVDRQLSALGCDSQRFVSSRTSKRTELPMDPDGLPCVMVEPTHLGLIHAHPDRNSRAGDAGRPIVKDTLHPRMVRSLDESADGLSYNTGRDLIRAIPTAIAEFEPSDSQGALHILPRLAVHETPGGPSRQLTQVFQLDRATQSRLEGAFRCVLRGNTSFETLEVQLPKLVSSLPERLREVGFALIEEPRPRPTFPDLTDRSGAADVEASRSNGSQGDRPILDVSILVRQSSDEHRCHRRAWGDHRELTVSDGGQLAPHLMRRRLEAEARRRAISTVVPSAVDLSGVSPTAARARLEIALAAGRPVVGAALEPRPQSNQDTSPAWAVICDLLLPEAEDGIRIVQLVRKIDEDAVLLEALAQVAWDTLGRPGKVIGIDENGDRKVVAVTSRDATATTATLRAFAEAVVSGAPSEPRMTASRCLGCSYATGCETRVTISGDDLWLVQSISDGNYDTLTKMGIRSVEQLAVTNDVSQHSGLAVPYHGAVAAVRARRGTPDPVLPAVEPVRTPLAVCQLETFSLELGQQYLVGLLRIDWAKDEEPTFTYRRVLREIQGVDAVTFRALRRRVHHVWYELFEQVPRVPVLHWFNYFHGRHGAQVLPESADLHKRFDLQGILKGANCLPIKAYKLGEVHDSLKLGAPIRSLLDDRWPRGLGSLRAGGVSEPELLAAMDDMIEVNHLKLEAIAKIAWRVGLIEPSAAATLAWPSSSRQVPLPES